MCTQQVFLRFNLSSPNLQISQRTHCPPTKTLFLFCPWRFLCLRLDIRNCEILSEYVIPGRLGQNILQNFCWKKQANFRNIYIWTCCKKMAKSLSNTKFKYLYMGFGIYTSLKYYFCVIPAKSCRVSLRV